MAEKISLVDRAMDFVCEVYRLVGLLPQKETYALGDQLRRAAVSIPSNIAEGAARGSNKEFLHFCRVADGSLQEVKCQIAIGVKLGYFSRDDAVGVYRHAEDIGRQLGGLIRFLSGTKNDKKG